MDTLVGQDGPRSVGGEALEAAYVAFSSEIRGRLLGRVRDPADADDLVQEAFLRLHLEIVACRPPLDPRAWLHRVARNLAISRGRHLQVAARAGPELDRGAGPSTPEEIVVRHDSASRLAMALTSLGVHERRVLLLAANGLTGPEIAERIGRTPPATRTLLYRARLRLRERIETLEQRHGSPSSRGGNRQPDEHHRLAMWAADSTRDVLHHSEQARPGDDDGTR